MKFNQQELLLRAQYLSSIVPQGLVVCVRACVLAGAYPAYEMVHIHKKGQFFILIFAMVRRIVEIPKHIYCIVWQEGQSIWANGIKKLTPRNDL